MTHALNGVIAQLTDAEAATVGALPEVQLIEEYRAYALDTDTGPALIGAPQVWNAASNPVKGEGIVIGVIDSGINFGSPSFAATDESGYTHINPRGNGNYLGTCAPGGVDEGRCNSKLIGGYDFVCGEPENACDNPLFREEPGFGDSEGHGSHTASTAAGNVRTAQFRGRPVTISGVAPRANVIAYDVCYVDTSDDRGRCPNFSTAAAVDQAIADGVDVINYSISGGEQPWSQVTSLAFLNAHAAGVYVATSAGNSGPGPNTLGHLEPWTASTAAAQHGRGEFGYLLQVTGPGAVPEALRIVSLTEGRDGATFLRAIAHSTPLRISAGIDGTDDGCAPYPANAFRGAIAVVRRGTCTFADKGRHAEAAGAVAMIVANNRAGGLSPAVAGLTIPAFAMGQEDADAVRDFAVARGNATTAGIAYPPSMIPNLPDVLGDFSSRGPAGTFDLVKPDLTAPGVSVLAAVAGDTISGHEEAIGLNNGTSMASPHHAGAAALLRQARPTWTVSEIKSALQMTATPEVDKEDGFTPGTPFDRGAGRIRIEQALRAGLVMDENRENFLAADPATGGDVSALNLPSLGKANCAVRCVFTRVVRSTQAVRQTWTAKLLGVSGTVSPALFTLNPGATRVLRITVNASALPADGSWNFGTVTLAPQAPGNAEQPTLRWPVAISVRAPIISVTPTVSVSVRAGSDAAVRVRIGNTGDSRLQFQLDQTGRGESTLHDSPVGEVTSGFRSTSYSDAAAAGRPAQFAADDFVVANPTRLTRVFAAGFRVGGEALTSGADLLTWQIYRNADGMPEGNPQTSPELAVWSFSAPPTAAAVQIEGANVSLDLATAGQNVALPAGRYWLVVHARAPFAQRWVWFASRTGDGVFRSFDAAPLDSRWQEGTGYAGLAWSLHGSSQCGASWFGTPDAALGAVAPGSGKDLQLQLNTSRLPPGNHVGYLCVASNDPKRPKVATAVLLTVTP
ncbi:MAG TPA: S8 family serine peptidase [Lysobacter sp.]